MPKIGDRFNPVDIFGAPWLEQVCSDPEPFEPSDYPHGFTPISSIPNFDPSAYLEPLHEFHDQRMEIGDPMKHVVCLYKGMLVNWVTTDREMLTQIRHHQEEQLLGKFSKQYKRRIARLGPACDWICIYCQRKGNENFGPDTRRWHVDHLYPSCMGGDNRQDNLILACATCNLQKNRKLTSEILALTKAKIENPSA